MEGIDLSVLCNSVEGYTLQNRKRRAALALSLLDLDARGIPGDIVECGVWRGGSIILARKLCPERVCWLYDTFTGMTQPGEWDRKHTGPHATDVWDSKVGAGNPWCAAAQDEVIANLRKFGVLDPAKICIVPGDVAESLKVRANIPQAIALLRLDTDWYESTRAELVALYPRLVPGGVLIVDDYHHWRGSAKAVKEYFGSYLPPMRQIDYSAIEIVKP